LAATCLFSLSFQRAKKGERIERERDLRSARAEKRDPGRKKNGNHKTTRLVLSLYLLEKGTLLFLFSLSLLHDKKQEKNSPALHTLSLSFLVPHPSVLSLTHSISLQKRKRKPF